MRGAFVALAILLSGCGTLLTGATLDGRFRTGHGRYDVEEVGERESRVRIVALELSPPRLVCRAEARVPRVRTIRSDPGFDLDMRLVSIGLAAVEALPAAMSYSIALGEAGATQYLLPAVLLTLDAAVAIALGIFMPGDTGARIEEREGSWAEQGVACGPGLALEADGERAPVSADGAIAPEDWERVAEPIARYGALVIAGPSDLVGVDVALDARCAIAADRVLPLPACEDRPPGTPAPVAIDATLRP